MNSKREQAIREAAERRFNIQPGETITADLRATIERTTILPNESQHDFASALDRPEKMSTVDFYHREARAKRAADWDAKHREPEDSRSDEIKARESRVALAEQQLAGEKSSPTRRDFFKRKVAEAKAELQQQIEKEAADQKAAETRAAIENDNNYQNALENADACLRLAKTDDEYKRAYLRREQLKSIKDPSEIPEAKRRYWAEVSADEEQLANTLEGDSLAAMKTASDAEKAASQAKQDVIHARHRAELARLESQ